MPTEKQTKQTPPQQNSTPSEPVEQEKTLFSWKAPARPFKRRNRDFYVTIVGIAAVVGIIVFLVDGWMPVILIVSLIFLFYVMSTIEPETVDYSLTSWGIKFGETRVGWADLGQFWFSRRFDSTLLVVSAAVFSGRIEIVVDQKDKAKITEVLEKQLKHEEVPPSFLDRASNWFSKKLPQG